MKLSEAKADAAETAKLNRLKMAVVDEGPHADEFAERDDDGKSYGYCPESGAPILYPRRPIVATVSPLDAMDPAPEVEALGFASNQAAAEHEAWLDKSREKIKALKGILTL